MNYIFFQLYRLFQRKQFRQEEKDNIISNIEKIYTKDITKFNCNYVKDLPISSYYKQYI